MSNQYVSGDNSLKDEAAILGVFFVAATAFIVAVVCIMLN